MIAEFTAVSTLWVRFKVEALATEVITLDSFPYSSVILVSSLCASVVLVWASQVKTV